MRGINGSRPLLLKGLVSILCSCLCLFLFIRFIEYGRYNGHYYGTSLDSVHRVMAEGKVCLLDVHPSVSVNMKERTIFNLKVFFTYRTQIYIFN